jgi:sugar lactone lactonase YvrE
VAAASHTWAFHGAHPVHLPARGLLYWADTLAPAIHAFDGTTDRVVVQLDTPIAGMQAHPDGLLIVQAGRHLLLDAHHEAITHDRPSVWSDQAVTLLAPDPAGRVWGWLQRDGSGHLGFVNDAERFDARWQFNETIDALAWSADGASAYATASGSGTIYLLQRGVAAVRRFASMPPGSGRLSGIALDDRGGIWVALKDGWSLMRFTDDGVLDRIVSLPVAAPTGLAFVRDAAGASIYVTSDRNQQPIESLASAPLSGHLLRLRIDS